jgi:hypothetical protein
MPSSTLPSRCSKPDVINDGDAGAPSSWSPARRLGAFVAEPHSRRNSAAHARPRGPGSTNAATAAMTSSSPPMGPACPQGPLMYLPPAPGRPATDRPPWRRELTPSAPGIDRPPRHLEAGGNLLDPDGVVGRPGLFDLGSPPGQPPAAIREDGQLRRGVPPDDRDGIGPGFRVDPQAPGQCPRPGTVHFSHCPRS